MTDDQEDTGSMAHMPKLHALLAEQGVTFTNSFVNLPLCAPSRASFFTGLCAHNTGIKANNPVDGGGWEAFKDKEANALPVWLDRAGYKTALLGKYVNRYGQQSNWGALLAWAGNLVNVELKGATIGNPRDWVPPGWDLWYAFTGTRARYFDYDVNDNGTILSFGHRAEDYSTDVLEGARHALHRRAGVISPSPSSSDRHKAVHAQGRVPIPAPQYAGPRRRKASHRPLVQSQGASPRAKTASSKSNQLAKDYRAELQSLQSVDDLVEAVVDALNRAGKLDNTLIVYTSDNGFLYGQHRLIGKSAAYEESIKVPLVMRGPRIPKDETRAELVNNLDVVATIAELAGVSPVMRSTAGRSPRSSPMPMRPGGAPFSSRARSATSRGLTAASPGCGPRR